MKKNLQELLLDMSQVNFDDLVSGILGYKRLPDALEGEVRRIYQEHAHKKGVDFNNVKTTEHMVADIQLLGKETEMQHFVDTIEAFRTSGLRCEKKIKKLQKKIKKLQKKIRKRDEEIETLNGEVSSWTNVTRQVQEKCDKLTADNDVLRTELIMACERADAAELTAMELTEKIEKVINDAQQIDSEHVLELIMILQKIVDKRSSQNADGAEKSFCDPSVASLESMQNTTTG